MHSKPNLFPKLCSPTKYHFVVIFIASPSFRGVYLWPPPPPPHMFPISPVISSLSSFSSPQSLSTSAHVEVSTYFHPTLHYLLFLAPVAMGYGMKSSRRESKRKSVSDFSRFAECVHLRGQCLKALVGFRNGPVECFTIRVTTVIFVGLGILVVP